MSGLPKTWSEVGLGDVIRTLMDFRGRTPKKLGMEWGGRIPALSAVNVRMGSLDLTRTNHFGSDALYERWMTHGDPKKGDIVLTMEAPLGNVAQVPDDGRYILSQRVVLIKTEDGIDPSFVATQLRSPDFQALLLKNATGTTAAGVSQARLVKLPIQIAPIAEQKRISKKLEAVLGRVDVCRARLDRVPALLKRFRQSVLAAATSGQLTEDWRADNVANNLVEKTLGEILRVSSGKALTAKNMATGGTIPVFGGNGINGYHDQTNVSEETLVIGRVGYYCGCLHLTPKEAWVTDNALIVRHDELNSSKRFLFYALQALDLRTNDSATAQPVISGQKIYSLKLLLPSLGEQQEIVRRVDALFALADRIESRLCSAQKTVERLTPSILAKAFRGELVPQDPNDEPASVLLKRISTRRPPESRRNLAGGVALSKRSLSSLISARETIVG